MMFGVFMIIKNNRNNDDDYISITDTFSIHAIITFIIITFLTITIIIFITVTIANVNKDGNTH